MASRVEVAWAAAIGTVAVLVIPPTSRHLAHGSSFDGWHPIWTLGDVSTPEGYYDHNRELAFPPLLAEWVALAVIAGAAIFSASPGPAASPQTAGRVSLRRGMPIYRGNGIAQDAGDVCEAAIAANDFSGHGVDEFGRHILSIRRDAKAFVVLADIQREPTFGDALILRAVYSTTPENVGALVRELAPKLP